MAISNFCESCGAVLRATAVFCGQCGYSRPQEPPAPVSFAPKPVPVLATAPVHNIPESSSSVTRVQISGTLPAAVVYLRALGGLWLACALLIVFQIGGLHFSVNPTVGGFLVEFWFFGLLFCAGGVGSASNDLVAAVVGYMAQGLALLGFLISVAITSSPSIVDNHPKTIEALSIFVIGGLGAAYMAWLFSDGAGERNVGADVAVLFTGSAVIILTVDLIALIHQAFDIGQKVSNAANASTGLIDFLQRLQGVVDGQALVSEIRVFWISVLCIIFGSIIRSIYVRMSRLEAQSR
jgi:hypothetical protein